METEDKALVLNLASGVDSDSNLILFFLVKEKKNKNETLHFPNSVWGAGKHMERKGL